MAEGGEDVAYCGGEEEESFWELEGYSLGL